MLIRKKKPDFSPFKVNLADIPGTAIVHDLDDKFQNASPRRQMQALSDKAQAREELRPLRR